MNTKEIQFSITFTPYTIDTYSTFTFDGEIDYILDSPEFDGLTYDDLEWSYDHKGLIIALAQTWEHLMRANVLDPVILSVRLDSAPYSPKFYNFETDNCFIVFTVDSDALESYIAGNIIDYDANHIRSGDGFMWFGDSDQTKLHYYLHTRSAEQYSVNEYEDDVREHAPIQDFISAKMPVL